MASALRKLSQADIETLHARLLRDAESDAEIWAWAEPRLPEDERGKSAAAGAMVVQRYRQGAHYREWRERTLEASARLERDIALQRQRFEMMRSMVSEGPDAEGMETVSRALQARLLTLAAEASDKDLIEGAAKSGWIKNVIRAVREDAEFRRKAAGEQAAETAANSALSPEERAARIREIFGK